MWLPHFLKHTNAVIWCNNSLDPRPSGGGIEGGCKGVVGGIAAWQLVWKEQVSTACFWVYEWDRCVYGISRTCWNNTAASSSLRWRSTQQHFIKILCSNITIKETSCDDSVYRALWNSMVWHAVFSPPLPDNDMEVTDEQLKGGEWQNISWLPFHLNTSIKAHTGWVSGVAAARDSDSPGFMQQMKLNVYSFGDKLNPGSDTSRLKILLVRYITLQELISTANSQLHSLHPAYGHNAFRPPKASDKGRAERHPSKTCTRR